MASALGALAGRVAFDHLVATGGGVNHALALEAVGVSHAVAPLVLTHRPVLPAHLTEGDRDVDRRPQRGQQAPVLVPRLVLEVFSVAELIVHPHKARRHAALRDGVVDVANTIYCQGRARPMGRGDSAGPAHEPFRGGHRRVVGNTDDRLRGLQRAAPQRRRELAAEAPHRDAAARGAVGEEERDAPEHDDAAPVAAHVVEKRRRRPPRDDGARAAGAFQERGHVLRCLEVGVVLELAGPRARRINSGEARRARLEAPAVAVHLLVEERARRSAPVADGAARDGGARREVRHGVEVRVLTFGRHVAVRERDLDRLEPLLRVRTRRVLPGVVVAVVAVVAAQVREVAGAGLAGYSFYVRGAVGLTDGRGGLAEHSRDCCIHAASLLCASNTALRRLILTASVRP